MKNALPQSLVQDIGEAHIPYLAYGSDGPPLVFLHATGFLPWMWHPIARELTPPFGVKHPISVNTARQIPRTEAWAGRSWPVT